MRANIILIAISLVLLITCSFCVFLMYRTSQQLMDIARIAADALPDHPQEAIEQLKLFRELWDRTEPRWQFISIHDDLAQVSQALQEAQDALLMNDIDTAKLACGRILESIDTIMHKELPTLGNIF